METPDLASITDKAWAGGSSLGQEPEDSITRQRWIVVSSTSHPLRPRPQSSRKPSPMGKKEHLVVGTIIVLISEMGMPALMKVRELGQSHTAYECRAGACPQGPCWGLDFRLPADFTHGLGSPSRPHRASPPS